MTSAKQGSSKPPAVLTRLFAVALLSLAGCDLSMRKFEPEEAGYLSEQGQLIAAMCRVGTQVKIPVGVTIDLGGNSSTGLKTLYKDSVVSDLEGAFRLFGQSAPDWREAREMTVGLLAPVSLGKVREGLIAALDAEIARSSAADGAWFPGEVHAAAETVCRIHGEFQKAVRLRPVPPEAPVLALSYQPPLVPTEFSLNSEGTFTVSVNSTILTPVGAFSGSASESYGPSKRLIIRDGETQRILLLDRPFKVFVPAEYGVRVTNRSEDIILDVVPRPGEGAG